jgi:hypothetical protein
MYMSIRDRRAMTFYGGRGTSPDNKPKTARDILGIRSGFGDPVLPSRAQASLSDRTLSSVIRQIYTSSLQLTLIIFPLRLSQTLRINNLHPPQCLSPIRSQTHTRRGRSRGCSCSSCSSHFLPRTPSTTACSRNPDCVGNSRYSIPSCYPPRI